MTRVAALTSLAALAIVSCAPALAGEKPVPPPFSFFDGPHRGQEYRSAGHPIYASPYSSSNMNTSMAGKTGAFGDDGVSGY